MKYLLDTCLVLWVLEDNRDKLKNFISIIEDAENKIIVSVVSYWEIVIKKSIGKLEITNELDEIIKQTGFSRLNLEYKHIEQLKKLPLIHHDPFDRILIAQSIVEQCKLLTVDDKILQYRLL